MKTLVAAVLFVILAHPIPKKEITDNEYVKIVMQSDETMKTVAAGTLSFQFIPAEGIHVNTNPSIEFVTEKNSLFSIAGEPKFSKDRNGYLNTAKEVRFAFSAKKGTMPGKYILKGSLRYFFCSDKDGWCNRHAQPIEITVDLTK